MINLKTKIGFTNSYKEFEINAYSIIMDKALLGKKF